jgi:hypothetical protein
MKHFIRIIALLGISLISLLVARPVHAFPPLPSSFHGTVKVNGENVPDGTLIQAMIHGQVYAEKQTYIFKGDSVYALVIPGDEAGSVVVEGESDGDTITFKIGARLADQTGLWKSGTNIALNLNAFTSATLIVPANTPTSLQTQTALPGMVDVSPTATTLGYSTSTVGVLTRTSSPPTAWMQPTLKSNATPRPENNPSNSSQTSKGIGVVAGASILFVILWLIFVRKPKVWK